MFIKIGSLVLNTDHIAEVELNESARFRTRETDEVSEVECVRIDLVHRSNVRRLHFFHDTALLLREYFEPGGLNGTLLVSTDRREFELDIGGISREKSKV